MRLMLLLFLAAGCAAPATQMEACPSCEERARVQKETENRAYVPHSDGVSHDWLIDSVSTKPSQ